MHITREPITTFKIKSISITSKTLLITLFNASPSSALAFSIQISSYLLSSTVDYFGFSRFYICGSIQCVLFLNWLLSFSVADFGVIHVAACVRGSFPILWNIILLYGLSAIIFFFRKDRVYILE